MQTEQSLREEITQLRREIGNAKVDETSQAEINELKKQVSELQSQLSSKKPLFTEPKKKEQDKDDDDEDSEENDDGFDW